MNRRQWIVPSAAAALLGAAAFLPPSGLLSAICGAALVGAVLAAVHHAEVVAHRVGEPLGTLVLALAVTIIEGSLIISMMISGGPATLARDTVFAAVMIICNGVIGLCVLVGGLRHREQTFRIEGAGPAFAALVALSTLVLALPAVTRSAPGAEYTGSQLVFAALASLVLWGVFVFVQTVRHRDYFLPVDDVGTEHAHLPPPPASAAWVSLGLLILSLIAVVGLAKLLSPRIEAAVKAAGAPQAVIGIAIAMLVLLPETLAAVRAARANRLQTSMNLALGSALATIGLTIPAVVVVSLAFGMRGHSRAGSQGPCPPGAHLLCRNGDAGLGRTSIMQGAVQLVVFGAFLFLSLVP